MRLANLHIQVRNLTSTTFEFRILKNRGYLRNSYRWCCEIPVILKRELRAVNIFFLKLYIADYPFFNYRVWAIIKTITYFKNFISLTRSFMISLSIIRRNWKQKQNNGKKLEDLLQIILKILHSWKISVFNYNFSF